MVSQLAVSAMTSSAYLTWKIQCVLAINPLYINDKKFLVHVNNMSSTTPWFTLEHINT